MSVRDPAVLQCKEVVELVSEFLGSALAPVDRARLEQHLLVCPPCTLHVAQVRATIAHIATLRDGHAPVEVTPALVDLFRQWKKKRTGDDGA
jgi:anti-sigma factor RsiW